MYIKNIRSIATANNTNGFQEFIEGISKYPIGVETTIANIIGSEVWNNMNRGDKIRLGKAIMTNIKSGNLKGLEPIETPSGQNQLYKVKSRIEMLSIFTSQYWGETDNVEELLKANKELKNFAFIKCSYITNKTNVILKTKAISSENKELYTTELVVDMNYFTKKNFNPKNYECKAILCLWYAYESVFNNRELLKLKGINSVCFIAPNNQMMERICGLRFDTKMSEYAYNEFIQQNFFQFKPNEVKELPFIHGIISSKNNNIK